MDDSLRKDQACHQFLDLIPKAKKNKQPLKISEETSRVLSSEDKNLELRLGPPGEVDWFNNNNSQHNTSRNSYDHFFNSAYAKNLVLNPLYQYQTSTAAHGVLHLQQSQQEGFKIPAMKEPPSLPLKNRRELPSLDPEEKAFSPAVHNSQKRTAPGPVVGWPPVRSFRKNLASGGSSSSKSPPPESENACPSKESRGQKPIENPAKNMLVKINMDGMPIGRKVDLKIYDSYEKLSIAVDKLFRGLLAAQNGGDGIKDKEGKAIEGLLVGSGEYKLVYEDNEGDKMLVGDVPWNMFVSTVKRLRVLRSSEISTLSRASIKGKALS